MVKFHKYTMYGNSFVIIDQFINPDLSEENLSDLGRQVTNVDYGVGCDNLIVFCHASQEYLEKIKAFRHYWDVLPPIEEKQEKIFFFRMFESDGTEALCCGNALLCLAQHCQERFGMEEAYFLTEIPSQCPVLRKISYNFPNANLCVGFPKPVGVEHYVAQGQITHYGDIAHFICSVPFQITKDELNYNGEVNLPVYLIHMGEPHLVIFDIEKYSPTSIPNLFDGMLIFSLEQFSFKEANSKNYFSKNILSLLGLSFNRLLDIFPQGINVNIARVIGDNVIVYRTFERGILKETLACGTGAAAVAAVVEKLEMAQKSQVLELIPQTAREVTQYKDKSIVLINDKAEGWHLSAQPTHVFSGELNVF